MFHCFEKASLTLYLSKCEYAKDSITYLGKEVGHGQVRLTAAKVSGIINYTAPTTKRQLHRFLVLVGYYRAFCCNFATIVSPLLILSALLGSGNGSPIVRLFKL